MKVLAISFAHNEIDFIKYKHQWCINQGLDLYIIDNESADGTAEYLAKHKIKSHRFNTYGEFHLKKLQAELVSVLDQLKPDWFIYLGVDEFLFMPNRIYDEVAEANKAGYFAIRSDIYNIFNTGEVINTNPFDTYFHYSMADAQVRIGKYRPYLRIEGDNYITKNCKTVTDSVLINYGMTKPKEQRERTYQRRIKAWRNGLNPLLGVHYKQANVNQWQWDKESLKDLRQSKINYVLDRFKEFAYL
jgi:hypothetical protein